MGIQYDVGVVTVNGIGTKSEMAIASLITPNPLTEAIYNYPDVTGLELLVKELTKVKGTIQSLLVRILDFNGDYLLVMSRWNLVVMLLRS